MDDLKKVENEIIRARTVVVLVATIAEAWWREWLHPSFLKTGSLTRDRFGYLASIRLVQSLQRAHGRLCEAWLACKTNIQTEGRIWEVWEFHPHIYGDPTHYGCGSDQACNSKERLADLQ